MSHSFASVFGIGHIPIASGSWASLLAVSVYYIFLSSQPLLQIIILIALVSLGGLIASNVAIPNKSSDPKYIVIDEVIGMWITCLFIPTSIWWFVMAFLIFRILDITKLPPINLLEKLHGGLGILADDIGAGLIGGALLFLASKVIILG